MTDINKINPKPIETVYEIKDEKEYQIPSYEEFMKNYQADENLNYDDLSGGSVGEVKGYGPCSRSDCRCEYGERYVDLYIPCPAVKQDGSRCPGSISSPTH